MAQANVVWVPIAIGSDNHAADLAFVITPELARSYMLSFGLLLRIKNTKLSDFILTWLTNKC
jgi:hypothetical protein